MPNKLESRVELQRQQLASHQRLHKLQRFPEGVCGLNKVPLQKLIRRLKLCCLSPLLGIAGYMVKHMQRKTRL